MDEVAKMTDTITATVRTADEYRRQAADCREQSERAPNPCHKENWLKIAGQWQHMAEMADAYCNTGASS